MAGLGVRTSRNRPHQSSKAAQKYMAQSPSLRNNQPSFQQIMSRRRNISSNHDPAKNDIALSISDPLSTTQQPPSAENGDRPLLVPASAASLLLYLALNLYGQGGALNAEEPTLKQSSVRSAASKVITGGNFSLQYRDHNEIGKRGNVAGTQG